MFLSCLGVCGTERIEWLSVPPRDRERVIGDGVLLAGSVCQHATQTEVPLSSLLTVSVCACVHACVRTMHVSQVQNQRGRVRGKRGGQREGRRKRRGDEGEERRAERGVDDGISSNVLYDKVHADDL